MMRWLRLALLCLCLAAVAFAHAQDSTPEASAAQLPAEICAANLPATEPATRTYTEALPVLQPGVDYRAVLCTEAGPVYVDLLEKSSPLTVNNFVFLAQNDYFNNTTFHRVLQDFMAQGGDPQGTGTGGPGYEFANETDGYLIFDRPGLLAMANAGPNTNGSQFFITTAVTSNLNYGYTIFGEVISGLENVVNLRLRDPDLNPDYLGARLDTVVIITEPSTIVGDYPENTADGSQEAVIANLTNGLSQFPPGSGFDTTVTPLALDAVVASAPEAQREDLRTLLSDNGFAFAVSATLGNSTCDLSGQSVPPFASLSYTLWAFEDAAQANAVLTSATLTDMGSDATLTRSADGSQAYYARPISACNTELTQIIAYVPRGRYIAVMMAVVGDTGGRLTPEIWLNELVGVVFENGLAPVLAPQMR
jgi:cyclophilin family peptidyl-prolyl cis-trans isomerase